MILWPRPGTLTEREREKKLDVDKTFFFFLCVEDDGRKGRSQILYIKHERGNGSMKKHEKKFCFCFWKVGRSSDNKQQVPPSPVIVVVVI